MAAEYVFIDEWDCDAPRAAVFDALADARAYPAWWKPVYIEVTSDGPPQVGRASQQLFKGRLPYRLRTTSTIARYEPPAEFEVEVTDDLSGRGVWTLTELDARRTHVKFDWRVNADRTLLRVLTPVLRPLFRANHGYAISRVMEGLAPYARAQAAAHAPRATK